MSDLIELAKQQAAEIARAGHNGWGNTMLALAAALEAAREDAKAVGTVLGGKFYYLRVNHGLPDGTMLCAIDQARGKGVAE